MTEITGLAVAAVRRSLGAWDARVGRRRQEYEVSSYRGFVGLLPVDANM
jgi:hypothetical protein